MKAFRVAGFHNHRGRDETPGRVVQTLVLQNGNDVPFVLSVHPCVDVYSVIRAAQRFGIRLH